MQEAWIQLQCPGCEEQREANPADLPEPQATRTCDSCGETRPTSEFTKTARDFEILESFHQNRGSGPTLNERRASDSGGSASE